MKTNPQLYSEHFAKPLAKYDADLHKILTQSLKPQQKQKTEPQALVDFNFLSRHFGGPVLTSTARQYTSIEDLNKKIKADFPGLDAINHPEVIKMYNANPKRFHHVANYLFS